MADSAPDIKCENSTKENLTGHEVVISGVSGTFPGSENVIEFMENLYNQVDMVQNANPEEMKYLAKIKGIQKFDACFFKINNKQAISMDPSCGKLLEHVFGAVYDAGINPFTLKGKRTGVFIGSSYSDSTTCVYDTLNRNSLIMMGNCSKSMYANRISYWINSTGPSYNIDCSSCSSLVCLEIAYSSIMRGDCEAAIIGGCNLCLHPVLTANFKRSGLLSTDGKTRCFDKNGNGYVRSEAVSVIYLQKAKDAKRIYAEVCRVQHKYGLNVDCELLPLRKFKDVQKFLESFYSEIHVQPENVEYVEADALGFREPDESELEIIGKTFGNISPVMVGCVNSNMGYAEAASGMCSLAKLCVAYQKGSIPGNLHYEESPSNLLSITNGKIKILTKQTQFNRGYTALNKFSYAGVNTHVLLKGHYKKKDLTKYVTNMPYLILASGRNSPCVMKVFNLLSNEPSDPELVGLLHSIHECDITGHTYRGYTILMDENRKFASLAHSVEFFSGSRRSLCFVYSGMGSQWPNMGAELMGIPTFAAAIEKCHKVLEPKGVDIIQILTNRDARTISNIMSNSIGIVAVQIGLTDILRTIEINPDYIIGHSLGELVCGYADGCLTAEETILTAYYSSYAAALTPLICGSMAAVGLGNNDALRICPPEIDIACRNSFQSTTISGPAKMIQAFVAKLNSLRIFAKEIPCSNIAFHSRYVADIGPNMLKLLRDVITAPKLRSKKWLSTSVPKEKWAEDCALFCSAQYITNNFLSVVNFESTSKLIPQNAVMVEIAPHSLLQGILKGSHRECTYIPLAKRGHINPVKFLLESLGKIYIQGYNPKVQALYPEIEFPVSTETTFLSHFVSWEHKEDWPELIFDSKEGDTSQLTSEINISLDDEEYKFLKGCLRDGNIIIPEATLLVVLWKTFAVFKGINYQDLSVLFKDIFFHKQIILKPDTPVKLYIMINRGANKFEICNDDEVIATGVIDAGDSTNTCDNTTFCFVEESENEETELVLTANDIYKLLHLKGYTYKDDFCTIVSSNLVRNKATFKYTDNWMLFLDSLLQVNVFSRKHNGISVPKFISKININTSLHKFSSGIDQNNSKINIVQVSNLYSVTRCGGVEIQNITFDDLPRSEEKKIEILKILKFLPHFPANRIDVNTSFEMILQIVMDNITSHINQVVRVTEVVSGRNSVTDALSKIAQNIPDCEFVFNVVKIINGNLYKQKRESYEKSDLIIFHHFVNNKKTKHIVNNETKEDCFVLILVDNIYDFVKPKYLNMISVSTVAKSLTLILFKKIISIEHVTDISITVARNDDFSWISHIEHNSKRNKHVLLVSERLQHCGLLGFIRKLNKIYTNKLRVFIIGDDYVPAFNLGHVMYKMQYQKQLQINVFKEGQWGGYYYVSLKDTMNHKNNMWIKQLAPKSSNLLQVSHTSLSIRCCNAEVNEVDFSGLDTNGSRVMGLYQGAVSNHIQVDSDLLWPVPKYWSLQDAATVPSSYIFAYYCLAIKYQIHRKKSVFISNGLGAFGQAIIYICLDLDCNVYTTVSDAESKKNLRRLFPKLNENNIDDSNNESFFHTIIENSNNKRCDLVINTFQGVLREAALKCVGSYGTFIDIIDYNCNISDATFDLAYLTYNKSYKTVELKNVIRESNVAERKVLQLMVAEGIAAGIVRPIIRIPLPFSDASKAIKCPSSPILECPGFESIPYVSYSSDAYILVNEANEFGLEIVENMIEKGARKIVIQTESLVNGYYQVKLDMWQKRGVTIKLSLTKLKSVKSCMNLLKKGGNLSKIKGIFVVHESKKNSKHGELDPENFTTAYNISAKVVHNLGKLAKKYCQDLTEFVFIRYTSNNLADEYAASSCDRICEKLSKNGVPALSLRLMLLEDIDGDNDEYSKLDRQTLHTVFRAMDASLRMKLNNVMTFNLNVNKRNNVIIRKYMKDTLCS